MHTKQKVHSNEGNESYKKKTNPKPPKTNQSTNKQKLAFALINSLVSGTAYTSKCYQCIYFLTSSRLAKVLSQKY